MMQEENAPKPKPKPKLILKRLSSFSSSQSSENLYNRPRILRSISYVEEDVPYRSRFWKCTLPIKVVQLVMSVMCAVLYYKGREMVSEGPRRSLANVVYYSYVVVNAITIIDYLVVQKIPGHGVRMLGFLGGVLFTVAGTISIETWGKEREDDEFGQEVRDMLLGGGILSLFNAALYFIDTIINFKMWLRALCYA